MITRAHSCGVELKLLIHIGQGSCPKGTLKATTSRLAKRTVSLHQPRTPPAKANPSNRSWRPATAYRHHDPSRLGRPPRGSSSGEYGHTALRLARRMLRNQGECARA